MKLRKRNRKRAPCRDSHCQLPCGYVRVGEGPVPLRVDVLIVFDASHKITSIDVFYDRIDWDDVLQLMNAKYGVDWREEENQSVITGYQTKKSESVTLIS